MVKLTSRCFFVTPAPSKCVQILPLRSPARNRDRADPMKSGLQVVQGCYRDAFAEFDEQIKVGVIKAGDGRAHGRCDMNIFTRTWTRHAEGLRCLSLHA